MKSFFAIAILGAIAFADDAADKAAVAALDNHGATIGKMENAIAIDAISIKTGNAADKGTLQLTTGWRETTGSDAETYVGFQWSIAPTAAYDSASSTLALAFGKDLSENNVLYTKYARQASGSNTFFKFNYVQLARSLTSLQTGNGVLTAAETTSLNSQRTLYTVAADSSISGATNITDAKVWDVDVANSTYTAATGAQTVYLQRPNAGVEEVKVGGASYVMWQFTDKDGSQNGGAYMKWADDAHDHAGAASVATFAAIAMVAALF